MVAGLEGAGSVVCDEQAADRQAVRETLGERHELRADVELLEGEEAAGAADAGLHLVEREERAELLRELGRGFHEVGLEWDHAALAEHGLEQDQADVA